MGGNAAIRGADYFGKQAIEEKKKVNSFCLCFRIRINP